MLFDDTGSCIWILVGAPGSGKSYWTNTHFPQGVTVASADKWFERSGSYIFDPTQLAQAHRFSQKTAEDALNRGLSVVVDNTSTRHRERKDYLKMAHSRGADIRVVVFPDRGFKNVHGVPDEKVAEMRARIDLDPGVYTWSPEDQYLFICPFEEAN